MWGETTGKRTKDYFTVSNLTLFDTNELYLVKENLVQCIWFSTLEKPFKLIS